MKKNNLIDFLIIVLVYIALSCIPFGLFIDKDSLSWLIITLQIAVQVLLIAFIILFTKFKTKLNYKDGKIIWINILLLAPTLIVCFSNLINLKIANLPIFFNNNLDLYLSIGLTLLVVINEELIFRLLFINNLEIKNKLLVILLTAGVFGICHITHFFSTFNPSDLLIIVYTFLLGLLLGFAYLFSKSIYPCIAIHLLFNLFNNILFPYFSLEWLYILVTAIIALVAGGYVLTLYFVKLNREIPQE